MGQEYTERVADDELLVTRWLLIGGSVWEHKHATMPRFRWWAIEPGKDETSLGGAASHGETLAEAIRKFVKEHSGKHPWAKNISNE